MNDSYHSRNGKFEEYVIKKGGGVSGTSLLKIPSQKLEYYDSKAKVYQKLV